MTIREPKLRVEIRRLEELAAREPENFKVSHRKAVLRALGWLALCQLVPVAVSLGGLAGLLWVDGYWVLDCVALVAGGWLALKVWRCLEVRVPDSAALTLDRRAYAVLFKDINEIRQKIGAPKFEQIKFTMELNAAVTQKPRLFGLFGVQSILYIGFPLIFCFTRDEFRTVLAHELAHVSRRHCLSRRLIMRVQWSWINLHTAFVGPGKGARTTITGKWLDWVMRAQTAHRVVADRMHEHEADKIAAAACGPEACAKALVKLRVLSHIYVEEFQASVENRIRESAFPNVSMLEEYLKMVERAARDSRQIREITRVEFARRTDLTASHPALADRLAAIGANGSGDVVLQGGAAEEYFGRDFKTLREELDASWVRAILPVWRERHEALRALAGRMHALSNMQDNGEKLHGYELLNIAAWCEELYGCRQGLAAYAEYHTKHPQVLEGRFHYGRLLLANRDPRGLEVLTPLIEAEPVYREAGLSLIKDFHNRVGNAGKVREVDEQLEVFYRDMKAVIEDRLEYRGFDVFHAHGMSPSFQDAVYRLCGKVEGIQRLHLLRKEVKYYTQSPFFVMVVAFNSKAGSLADREELMNVLRFVVELPGDCVVVDAADHFRLARRLKKELAATKIYDRSDG